MSDPDGDEREVTVDGVRIRHRLDFEQFPLPVASFRVESERDDPARVHLRVPLPDGMSSDGVGFHNDFDGEHWVVDGDEVLFERPFDPGEECETLFATDGIDEGQEPLLGDAVVEVLRPDERESDDLAAGGDTLSMSDLVDGETDARVRELIAGERSSLPGLSDDEDGSSVDDSSSVDDGSNAGDGGVAAEGDPTETEPVEIDSAENGESAADDDPVAELNLTEPEPEAGATGDGETPTDAASETGAGGDEEPEPVDAEATAEPDEPAPAAASADGAERAADGGVARVLLKELRSGYVSEEQRDALREELGGTDGRQAGERSTDVRLRRLESQMSELNAYVDALETFIDEEGTGAELIEELRDDTRDVEAELRAVRETVDGVESRVDGVESEMDGVRADVGGIESEVDEVRADVDDVDARVDETRAEVRDVESEVDGLRDEFERIEKFYDRMAGLFSDAELDGD